MRFEKHLELAGKHAFLAPSKYSWINYDEDKLDRVYVAALQAQRGTELHALAHQLIRLGVKLPRSPKSLNTYVNDAIGFRMTPEQHLFYSANCFGTADSIAFRKNILRVHDLKTGVTPTSEHQLEVYAALFCLEYKFKPFEIEIELRIYQNDEVRVYEADPDVIFHVMERIIYFDKRINEIRMEAES
jgi:Protein of unknown function (DUF2800)